MSKLILANKGCIPSAITLREQIRKLSGIKLLVTTNPEKENIVFRYGNSSMTNYPSKDIVNNASFIYLSSNKQLFSQFCIINGIRAPIFNKLNFQMPDEFPILVRETLSGKGCEGIHKIYSVENLIGLNPNWNWTPYCNIKKEYRVHIINGKIIRVFEKIFQGENNDGIIIRNNDNSKFSLIENINEKILIGKFTRLNEVSLKLYDLLSEKHENIPLMFSLDIGFDAEKRDYIIFEANSASGLNENTAMEYAKEIIKLMEI